jgi:hypothetical protein
MRYKMWLKFKLGIFGIIFLSTVALLTGCLEEPTIAPARRPYSVMRVVNLSNSSDQIYIDGEQPDPSLSDAVLPSTSLYFDMNSGARAMVVKDANADTIFNNNIDIISYEREIIVYSGTYDIIEDNNSFSNMKVSEGEIYFNTNPDAGKLDFIISNSFPGYYVDGADVNPAKFSLKAVYWPDPDSAEVFDTTTYISGDPTVGDDLLEFGVTYNIGNTDPGIYKFLFSVRNFAATGDSLVIADSSFYSSDRRNYLFVYGNPDVFAIYRDEFESFPIRSIYE